MVPSKDTTAAELRRRNLPKATLVEAELVDEAPLLSPPFQDVDDKSMKVAAQAEAKARSVTPARQPVNWTFVLLLTIAAYATRFYKISAGNFVLYGTCLDAMLMSF